MEKRLLIAFVLSAVIFAVWSVLFPPPKRTAPGAVQGQATPTATATTVPEAAAVVEEAPEAPEPEPEEVVAEARAADAVATLTLSSETMEVEVTNRGAALSSIRLVEFRSDDGTVLDLVQAMDLEDRLLPLQLSVDGRPDDRLYTLEAVDDGAVMEWSDGRGSAVRKEIRLQPEGFGIEVSVEASGDLERAELAVGTGMRNTGPAERKNRFSTWGDVVISADGELEDYKREKLKESVTLEPGTVGFVGFADTYFINIFQPAERVQAVTVQPFSYVETDSEGVSQDLQVLQVRLRAADGSWGGRLFTAPKEYDLLHAEGGGLDRLLDFGIFHPISVVFLKALRWIYARVGNYGVAIILLTLAIRIVLFPLMHTSTVSMRRMQKLQPKVKAIQEKYKKNKTDPQVRQRMNQEMMALYKAEGVNPMGGCLPVLVQLPILWSLYTLFAHAIELRHAPFIWWIEDLSAKDPILITPILMTATMWLQQKLAPQAGDPQQQKIFRMMPLIFGIMFLGFPSGLVLYWLSNNVITIIQQEVTLRLIGERGAKAGARSGGGSKGKKS